MKTASRCFYFQKTEVKTDENSNPVIKQESLWQESLHFVFNIFYVRFIILSRNGHTILA